MRKEEEHDGRVHELVQERPEQRRPTRVTISVGDHTDTEYRAAAEHEANRDEDVERVDKEFQGGGKNDPHLKGGRSLHKTKGRGGGG